MKRAAVWTIPQPETGLPNENIRPSPFDKARSDSHAADAAPPW